MENVDEVAANPDAAEKQHPREQKKIDDVFADKYEDPYLFYGNNPHKESPPIAKPVGEIDDLMGKHQYDEDSSSKISGTKEEYDPSEADGDKMNGRNSYELKVSKCQESHKVENEADEEEADEEDNNDNDNDNAKGKEDEIDSPKPEDAQLGTPKIGIREGNNSRDIWEEVVSDPIIEEVNQVGIQICDDWDKNNGIQLCEDEKLGKIFDESKENLSDTGEINASENVCISFIEMFNSTDKLMLDGKYEQAKIQLQKILMLIMQSSYCKYFESMVYDRLSSILIQENDVDAAISMRNKSIEISNASRNALCAGKFEQNIGYYILNKGNEQKDDKVRNSISLNIAKALGLKSDIIASSIRLGYALQSNGFFEDAIEKYQLCIKTCHEMNDFSNGSKATSNMAHCFRMIHRFNDAIQASEECIQLLSKKDGNTFSIAIENKNISNAAFMIGNHELCIQSATKAIEQFTAIRDVMNSSELTYLRENEKIIYGWIILSQIRLGLFVESILTCECSRLRNFLNLVGKEAAGDIDYSVYNFDVLRQAINELQIICLYYQIVPIDQHINYLIAWAITPADNNNMDDIQISCRIIDIDANIPSLISMEGIDARAWILNKRQQIGFRGWELPETFKQQQRTTNTNSDDPGGSQHLQYFDGLKAKISQFFIGKMFIKFTNSMAFNFVYDSTLFTFTFSIVLAIFPLSLLFGIVLIIVTTVNACLSAIFNIIFRSIEKSQLLYIQQATETLHQGFQQTDRSDIIRRLRNKYKNIINDDSTITSSSGDPVVIACKELYNKLFGIFKNDLQHLKDGQELLIISHDVLGLLPFPAMICPDGNYIIRKYKLRQVPSIILAWQLLKKVAEKRGICPGESSNRRLWQQVHIGGKATMYQRAEHTTAMEELTQVSALLQYENIGFKQYNPRSGPRTEEISESLRQASVLHLATHASTKGAIIVRGDQEVSDAYYCPSDIIDTYLKFGELRPDLVILNLNFSDTDTYSCDNIDGLTRALLTCGVSCVITTISDVDALTSHGVMKHFYYCLLGVKETDITANRATLDSVEALQAAMLRLLRVTGRKSKPNVWAPYVISGIAVDSYGPKL